MLKAGASQSKTARARAMRIMPKCPGAKAAAVGLRLARGRIQFLKIAIYRTREYQVLARSQVSLGKASAMDVLWGAPWCEGVCSARASTRVSDRLAATRPPFYPAT